MSQSHSIIIGAALIAAAILVTNHWAIVSAPNGLIAARLNRWTGSIEVCAIDPKTTGAGLAGAQMACHPL